MEVRWIAIVVIRLAEYPERIGILSLGAYVLWSTDWFNRMIYFAGPRAAVSDYAREEWRFEHRLWKCERRDARIRASQRGGDDMIAKGERAPEFEGTLADGKQLRLRDFRGRRHIILYFFPKDFTPGCTKEACSFRDRRAEIAALDAEIVGVSLDTPEKHASFAEKYQLPYPLISDRSAAIATAFGVSRLGGWLPTKRVTFVIDKQGVVQKVIQSEFSIDMHINEALETLRSLQGA